MDSRHRRNHFAKLKQRANIYLLLCPLFIGHAYAQEYSSDTVTSLIGHFKKIYSHTLHEDRTLLVHLPDNYETSSMQYPVLFVLDAEGTQRFIHSISAIMFYSGIRRLPRMIVIGIVNRYRTRDITPFKVKQRASSGGGDAFLEFIASELIPHVEETYRCAPYSMFCGGSSAGTFTLYTLFTRPELFDAYIASRPALNNTPDYSWNSDIVLQMADKLLTSRSSLPKTVYMDYGGQEDGFHDPDPVCRLSKLFEENAPADFRWETRPMGESGYRSSESLIEGLLTVFDVWHYAADSLYIRGFDGIEHHAKTLSQRYGYTVTVADLLSENDLMMFGYRFLEHGDMEEALSVFTYVAEMYPDNTYAEEEVKRLKSEK